MARHKERDVEAQIRALVDIFIQGITPREALVTLDEGPAALGSACFSWAFQAADQIDGVPELDPTRRASLRGRAPLVKRLRELAIEAFLARFGEPNAPRLPERPEGLETTVRTEQDAAEHQRISRSARDLFRTAVHGMFTSWESWFFITRNRDRSQFVLWCKWNDGESNRCFTTAAGWMDAVKGLSERDAALILLEDYWTARRNEWSASRPREYVATGDTVTQDELELVAERVWPTT